MSVIKFACPKCKQSLEGDDSMRGQVVECPSCNTQITVPPAPQKKQVLLPKQQASGSSPAYTPPPKTKSSKGGIAVALVIGLVIGYGAGLAKQPSGIINSFGRGIGLPGFGAMTKDEWKARVDKNFPGFRTGREFVDKERFVAVMGKPDRTQTINNDPFWYYQCSDGMIQMEWRDVGTDGKKIAMWGLNDY